MLKRTHRHKYRPTIYEIEVRADAFIIELNVHIERLDSFVFVQLSKQFHHRNEWKKVSSRNNNEK